jgi:hypothetical protein
VSATESLLFDITGTSDVRADRFLRSMFEAIFILMLVGPHILTCGT